MQAFDDSVFPPDISHIDELEKNTISNFETLLNIVHAKLEEAQVVFRLPNSTLAPVTE
jgi:hypothetical protein